MLTNLTMMKGPIEFIDLTVSRKKPPFIKDEVKGSEFLNAGVELAQAVKEISVFQARDAAKIVLEITKSCADAASFLLRCYLDEKGWPNPKK